MSADDRFQHPTVRFMLIAALTAIIAAGAVVVAGAGAPASAANTCANGGSCVLGDVGPGGGIVFFVKGSGSFSATRTIADTGGACSNFGNCHPYTVSVALTSDQQAALPFDYLEVGPAVAQINKVWSGGQSDLANANGQLIGTGAADSQAVVDGFPADDNASSTSLGYAIPGASDWFLPSYDELSLILIRASTDGAAMGTFAATMWSSTQFGSSAARALDFSTGQDLHVTKTTASVGVRPIRAFSAATTTATTTTNASATTTVPESTTTVPESTTTVPESTTTAPESTTTTSTGTATTAVPASITAVVSGAVRTNVALTEATTASSLAGPPTSTTSSAAAPTEAAVLAMQESPLGAPPSPAPGQQVTVSASNFPPFGIGQIYIASTPVLLGTSVADDFGSIAITVVLPSDYTGPHSLVLYQPSIGSGVRQSIVFSSPPVIAYSSATTVANAPSNTVANTTSNTDAYGNVMPASGWDSVDGVMQGLVLVLLGGGCLIAVRRRSDVAS